MKLKKILAAGLFCLSVSATAQEQATYEVERVEPKMEDILNIFKGMDIHLSRFDVSRFLDTVYRMEIYVKEYKNNQETGRVHHFDLQKNIGSLNDFRQEDWPTLRQIHQLSEGEKEWVNIKEISIYIRKDQERDSTAFIQIAVPGLGDQSVPFAIYPADGKHFYSYNTRPFAIHAASPADRLEIPLLLYGSSWAEPGTTFFRFCGESEIDPEMKAEILTHIPHYYVIGLRLEKAGADGQLQSPAAH